MKNIGIIIFSVLSFLNSYCYLQLQIFKSQLQEKLKDKSLQCLTIEVDEAREKKQRQKRKKKRVLASKQDSEQQKSKDKDTEEEDQQQQDEDEQQNSEDEEVEDEEIPQSQNYRQLCYQKDISYSLPMYYKQTLSYISLDTTIPISWFKGQKCRLQASSKKCSKVSINMKQKITQKFKSEQKKPNHSSALYAIIEGSSQLVKGIEQKGKNFQFITRDSSRLTNFIQLLMLGFYMKGEKDTVVLQNTTFINAVEISRNLNYLCDGAISLRFDDMSQKSFVNQLLAYQKIQDKFVTIKIGPYNSLISFGQIALKYSKNGYGGLQWMDIKQDQNYGKLPIITDIIIQNKGETGHKFSQIKDKEYPAVISLSASYIGIPKQAMQEWLKKFNKKSDCQVNEKTMYLQCKHYNSQQQKIITFVFGNIKISFSMSELMIGKVKNKTLFNMKQTIHDTYAILGEPFFLKYLVVFGYNNNKVGFGEKFNGDDQQFINVVSVIRFVCFVFVFGCSFILCYLPIKRCLEIIKSKTKYGVNTGSKGQTRRLKQYAPIQQNPYDQLSSKVKEALQSQQTH